MTLATRHPVIVLAVVALGAGCSQLPGFGGGGVSSPSATPSQVAAIDSAIPTPSGFPSDLPVYPRARLTAAASFASTGQVAWGMEWATTDPPATVQAFYVKQLNQGDWTLRVGGPPTGPAFAGTFARKSNARETGTIAVSSDQGVTVIAVSFLSSG